MIETDSRPAVDAPDSRLLLVTALEGVVEGAIPWWLWGNVFSLEAPAVAVFWCALFSRSLHIPVSWAALAVLGMTVWVIYLADHVLDARAGLWQFAEPARKRYFRQHPKLTLCLLTSGFVATVTLAFRCLDRELLRFGAAGSVVVALYLATVQLRPVLLRRFWPREAIVSALFVWGICLPLWPAARSSLWQLVPIATPLYLLCWMNCCLIECLDWRRSGGGGAGQPNVIALWIERHARAFSRGILAFTIAVATLLRPSLGCFLALVLTCCCFQLVEFANRKWRKRNALTPSHFDRLCLVLDLALMTPFPVLLWLHTLRIWH